MTTINDLKTQLRGGLRKNKYQIIFQPPGNFLTSEKLNLLCKGSSLPTKTISNVDVFHYGRRYSLRGETIYDPAIELTFYDDDKMNVRRIFDYWTYLIDNSRKTGESSPMTDAFNEPNYQRDIEIWQLNSLQNRVYGYTLFNCFPIQPGVVTYDDSENDSLVEFNVTFQFSEFEPITAQ